MEHSRRLKQLISEILRIIQSRTFQNLKKNEFPVYLLFKNFAFTDSFLSETNQLKTATSILRKITD